MGINLVLTLGLKWEEIFPSSVLFWESIVIWMKWSVPPSLAAFGKACLQQKLRSVPCSANENRIPAVGDSNLNCLGQSSRSSITIPLSCQGHSNAFLKRDGQWPLWLCGVCGYVLKDWKYSLIQYRTERAEVMYCVCLQNIKRKRMNCSPSSLKARTRSVWVETATRDV